MSQYTVTEINTTKVIRTWVVEAEDPMEAYNIAQTKQPDTEKVIEEEGDFSVSENAR